MVAAPPREPCVNVPCCSRPAAQGETVPRLPGPAWPIDNCDDNDDCNGNSNDDDDLGLGQLHREKQFPAFQVVCGGYTNGGFTNRQILRWYIGIDENAADDDDDDIVLAQLHREKQFPAFQVTFIIISMIN